MLKRIAPSQVRLGMYIQSFEGNWLAHPFWGTHFHVTDPADLERVQASKVRAVVIDASKTIEVAPPADIVQMPVCVANDRVPETVAGGAMRPSRQHAAIANDMRALVTRHLASEPASASSAARSAQTERADVIRVLASSTRTVHAAFANVARGGPLSLEGFDRVVDGISEAMATSRSTMIGLSRLKLKDEYTFLHSVAVGALLLGFARELELEEEITRDLALGGLLHDVGKMMIPDAILNKPGPLTDAEFAEMKRHPALGCDILKRDDSISPIVLDVTLRHHERIDGLGYPGGLAGDEVSLYARMAGICDVFDALTSARVYKDAMPAHEAIAMMAGWDGQFDRDLLVVFMRSVGLYPPGLLVRLSSQRLGIVLPPGRRAGRPRARVVHCATSDTPLPPCDVVISEGRHGERVIAEEKPENWSIEDWPAVRERCLGTAARHAA